ncbi:MAG TPA: peptidoglycan recognition family protein [Nocardioides sp.]|uniref:N-acetylmuramoyl-L-alanine amidase n=1 Tax=Nocardioides sp. TaxID=35761 RepID=UPI002F3FB5B2
MSSRSCTRSLGAISAAGALVSGILIATTSPAPAEHSGPGGRWQSCLTGTSDRQAVFSRAAAASGVPRAVLLGVSYMESRWDDHAGAPSTAGGYGPMHLTHVIASSPQSAPDRLGKGDGGREPRLPSYADASPLSTAQARTLDRAATLTGLSASSLRTDPVANICAGAALLASYHHGATTGLDSWSAAVGRYSTASDQPTALRFTREVYAVIRSGAARTTNDGQRVRLAAHPGARVDVAQVRSLGLTTPEDDPRMDCPSSLGCEWVPAPYQKYGDSPGAYGNHDLADRPHDLKIDDIVIHDTEASWDTTLQLVQDPTYLGWHYSIRSSDGQIAAHMDPKDVGWHAGNWYVNMHSIGVEHEGFAAQGGTWYTESLYESSAALVSHLAHEYNVPIDRAHIIGHDQVPGITPAYVAGMHWDPGPYWDWEHYMALLGSPITADKHADGDLVTVKPGFVDNQQQVTGCDPDGTCPAQGTNFVYLHQSPSTDSPLVTDIGLHPDGSPSTTEVADIGARAAAGQQLDVAGRSGDWLGVWWLGEEGWIYDPASHPSVVPSSGRVVVAAGDQAVPVYGRAYPEESAYPSQIPYQTVTPLQYSIRPGQSYVLADDDLQTDYYYAKTFRCAGVALDCTDVVGQDQYYEIWFGHRIAYVRAADVRITGG